MDVSAFLGGFRARLRRVLIVEGVARALLAVVLVAAALVTLDWLFPLPGWLRFGSLIVLVTSVAMVVRRRLTRPLSRPMDDQSLARLVERRLPALDGRLISGIEGLTLSEHDRRDLSGLLAGGIAAQLVPARTLPRQIALAVLAVLGAGVVALLAPDLIRAGLARLLLPFGETAWTPGSDLVASLERPVVPADEPLVLEVRRPRGGEATVKVAWRDPSGHRPAELRTLDGSVGAVGRRQTLSLPAGSYQLTVTSGDAEPVVLAARVVTRPTLARINATLTPPAYAAEPPQQLATLACTALAGSTLAFTVEFALEPDRRVERFALLLGTESLPVTRSAHGFSGELLVKQGGELVVTIADQDGITPKPEPRFVLSVAGDRAPEVHLDGPRNNEAVSARATLTIKVDARDDHGLASLSLARQVTPVAAEGTQPKPGAEAPLISFPSVSGLATTRPYQLDVGAYAKVGERLALIGHASDANAVSGPGLGASEPLVLRVVSEEELRQELERLLGDALERVRQSREELGRGLATAEQLATASRNATLPARKAAELLEQVKRRASDNQFPNDELKPIATAAELVGGGALPQLTAAAAGGEPAAPSARAADAKLAEAERVLASLRQESDLSRQLSHLLGMEKNLAGETKALLKEHLTSALDEAAKTRLADLAERQRGLAGQLKELERRLLASPSAQLAEPQALVNQEQPAEQLSQAAQALATPEQRAQAPGHQDAAIKAMEALLAKLRGSEANLGLAERFGELAERQEQLVKELERGADPRSLSERQEELRDETRKLESLVEQQAKDPEATKSAKGAGASQEQAAGKMQQGDAGGAAREGSAAAAQLREAQRRLQGEQTPADPQGEKKKNADVMRLLRELRSLQVRVLNDSLPLHQRIGERPLDFAAQRDLAPIADLQLEIVLRLREEGIKELEQMPIAARALGRVAEAMQRSADRLATPALGETGITLEKTALYELNRLINVVDTMPQGKAGDGKGGSGDGQQAPFPPAAQLALMIAEQEDLARRVATNAPGNPVEDQQVLLELVETMRQQARPGSRPNVLLERGARAMASSAYLLAQHERGLTVRHEQELAVAALRRILAEAESGGGGGGSDSGGSSQAQRPKGDPSRPGGNPSQGEQNGGSSQSGSNQSGNQATPGSVTVVGGVEASSPLMHLPQERRDQLREAAQQHLPPAALRLYQRYLELLEEDR